MAFIKITDENFILYAMHNYNNLECNGVEDFNEDISRIKYIKRLLRKYLNSGELKERLIINHLVLLGNVFGVEVTTRILFFKIEKELWPILKTFLVFLNYMQEDLYNPDIISSNIPLDQNIVNMLREI
jgi:hypothetical protein